jgi:hypothetical protein
MKVKIGPYINYIGTYQLVDKLFFWHEKYPEVDLEKRWDYKLHNDFAEWLSETWVEDLCQWIYEKRQREVKIHIDHYDVWSMDSALALIILPMLKRLKEVKHGSPMVELDDVPLGMRFTETEEYDSQFTFDFYQDPDLCKQNVKCDIHSRWDWALNEMIWAFEQLQPDSDWEDQYWITNPELDLSRTDSGITPVKWKVEGECDWEGRAEHQKRITNGLMLFGRYFQALWD